MHKSRPRYTPSGEVVDILKKKKFLGIFPYWVYVDTIKNVGQIDRVVYLLDNLEYLETSREKADFLRRENVQKKARFRNDKMIF